MNKEELSLFILKMNESIAKLGNTLSKVEIGEEKDSNISHLIEYTLEEIKDNVADAISFNNNERDDIQGSFGHSCNYRESIINTRTVLEKVAKVLENNNIRYIFHDFTGNANFLSMILPDYDSAGISLTLRGSNIDIHFDYIKDATRGCKTRERYSVPVDEDFNIIADIIKAKRPTSTDEIDSRFSKYSNH